MPLYRVPLISPTPTDRRKKLDVPVMLALADTPEQARTMVAFDKQSYPDYAVGPATELTGPVVWCHHVRERDDAPSNPETVQTLTGAALARNPELARMLADLDTTLHAENPDGSLRASDGERERAWDLRRRLVAMLA